MKLRRPGAPGGTTLAIVAEGFLSRLSFGLVSLTLPLYALHLGMGLGEVGLLVSVNVILQLVAKPLMAPLADRFGHRRTLLVAIAGRSLVCLLLALSVLPWQLFAVRLLYGLTQALRDPPLNAVIADAGGSSRVASMFSWYHTAKNVAASLGRAGAGLLLALGPESYRGVFLLAFGLSLLPLAVVARYLRPAGRASEATGSMDPTAVSGSAVSGSAVSGSGVSGSGSAQSMNPPDHPAPAGVTSGGTSRRPRVLRLTVLGFLFGTTAGMLNLFPAIAAVYFKLNPAQIGLIMLGSAVVVIVAGPLFGWLADHRSRTVVLMIRGFANIVSSLMYLVFPSFWGVGASKLVDDTGKAAFRPAWGSVMAEVASEQPDRRARVMAFIDVGEDAGDAAGPILAGWLLVLGGLPLMLGVRCGLAAVTEVWTWWTTHRSDQPSSSGNVTSSPDPASGTGRHQGLDGGE